MYRELARERWAFAAGGPRRLRAPRLLAGGLDRALERIRWAFVERPIFEGWLRGAPWGRLFARYQRLGYGENRGV